MSEISIPELHREAVAEWARYRLLVEACLEYLRYSFPGMTVAGALASVETETGGHATRAAGRAEAKILHALLAILKAEGRDDEIL